jgi:uncharacterized lipoprotein YddW (UPF0748 family)
MSKRFIISLYIFFSWIALFAQSSVSPKYEVRAVWLTTIGGLDWPHSYARSSYGIEKQKDELRTLLDLYQKAGINTVLIQTRIRGTTIYPSKYEPWDGCLSGNPGQSPGYDALQFAIDECHKRGMELHAWVVTIPVGKWNKLGCQKLRRKYPSLIKKIGLDGYMNPEDPRTASYLADICEEIATNYDIDGIHLDYIRYPETWKLKVSHEQGRRYITNIVSAIHNKVKTRKPWVKISASPIGKFNDLSRYRSNGWNAYTRVCQDAQGWLRDGLMDQLYPMMYFRNDQFFPFAIDWAEQNSGKTVAPGLGIYFLNPREGNWKLSDITREMHILRQYGLGQTYFRGKFLTDNEQGIYDFVSQFNRHLALVPPMTWAGKTEPQAPGTIQVYNNGMKWSGSTPYYNIYSSRTWPVDTDNPENLIAIRRQDNSITLPTEGRYFAVTGMDRYGNESRAQQSHNIPKAKPIDVPLLKCDGKWLTLPPKDHALDAKLVTVETLQGSIIGIYNYQGKAINISHLPEGFYVLKSLGKKSITHRLGFFKIERKKR